MSFVAELFNHAPDEQTQASLASAFWPGTKCRLENLSDFFRHFKDRIELLKWPYGVDETHFATHTFGELIDVVSEMWMSRNRPREEVLRAISQLQVFRSKTLTESQILNAMALAACLWLTMEVRIFDSRLVGPTSGAFEYAVWSPGQTLMDVARQPFRTSKFLPTAREARLDPGFTANNLMSICGIRIAWTDNLIDHLHYDSSPAPMSWWQIWQYRGSAGTVYIYPHKLCLASHYAATDIFEKDLLEETMRSLDLLFPFGDNQTRGFLQREGHRFFLAETPIFPRTTDLGDFNYWRRRIVILYDAFNAPPFGAHQMWKDRRNPMQWWTFWLAVFIILLTFVFGIISVYTAFKSIEVAEQAYNLALLQACGDNASINQICRGRGG